jgi:hypothetical protein
LGPGNALFWDKGPALDVVEVKRLYAHRQAASAADAEVPQVPRKIVPDVEPR